MSKYWSKIVKKLDPYVPGEQPKIENLIKLNTNENPYGPSPEAIRVMQDMEKDTLRLYPDPNADELKKALAEFYSLETDQVFVGNGSDEVLAHVYRALLTHDKPLLFPDISYSFYPVYCGLFEVNYVQVPLDDDFSINVEDYIRENGGILLANPNAPTGLALSLKDIETILQTTRDSVVVIDEAYIDFGGESAVPLISQYDNLLVVQTFSKSRSLAGLRIGYAMGNANLIDALERVKNSFNSYPLSRFAIQAGAAAVKDRKYFERTCNAIIETRTWLTEELENRGFEVIPSSANFVFAQKDGYKTETLFRALRERAILVRYFNKPKIDKYLRITIGSEEECRALIAALDDIFSST